MKTMKQLKKILAGIMTALLALFMGVGFSAVPVSAAKGIVYTAKIHPCYAHPVTGVIEDSGGQASYATGQGMVEGCISATGILEVTESGEYYLTIRMSLIDYTSNQSFQVQNSGDSGWSVPGMGVTGNGTDTNGTTADICIQVPGKNCVAKGSMYVEPMGRTVIFYLYPSDFVEGNSTDMKTTMVTESASASENGSTDADNESGTDNQTTGNGSSAGTADSNISGAGSPDSAGNPVQNPAAEAAPTASGTLEQTENNAAGQQPDNSSVTAAASETSEVPSTVQPAAVQSDGSALAAAKGLSLSTAGEAVNREASKASDTSADSKHVVLIVLSILFIASAAGGIYFIYKKKYRQGGNHNDRL